VLACFRQPRHPGCLLPPGPASGAGREEAGREDSRAAKVPQLLSHHPSLSTWQCTSSSGSIQRQVLPHFRALPTLEVWGEETSPTPLLGQDLATSWPWGTPRARSRRQRPGCYVAACKAGRNQGDTQKKNSAWGTEKNPACCSCLPRCPGTPNLVMRKSQLLLKINRAPASRAE